MTLNDFGKAVEWTWTDLPRHNVNIELDEFIIMPNHVHGIIRIVGAGSKPALMQSSKPALMQSSKPALMQSSKPALMNGSNPDDKGQGLSEILRQFKTFSARRVNQIRNSTGVPLWQRDFFEQIIRNDADLRRVREYIVNNPILWESDDYFCRLNGGF
ncbi:MAG: transposase [Candidatus Omnitrophica bacterium]|nr:transposase [Candidatus Omnitrophota bacterium]